MVDKFAGKWEMVDVTGLEDFLKGMGKDDMFKAILLKLPKGMIPKGKVEIEVSAGGNHIKIVVDSPVFKGHTEEFDLGVETERNTIDGRKVKSLLTFDEVENKLFEKQTQVNPEDKVAQINYAIDTDGRLIMTSVAEDGATCVRTMKRVKGAGRTCYLSGGHGCG